MLSLENVHVRFGAVDALAGVDLVVKPNEAIAILGPSGSGKSTLLRVIAGLVEPDSGAVLIGGADVSTVPPHRRGVGLMFQEGLLFPHLSVADNIAYGLTMRGMPAAERRARVTTLLDLVGLPSGEFADRAVTVLSGGEQQRVALARSLAPEPSVLLLDEPFGSLDAVLRGRLADDVRSITRQLGTTVVTVTHDRSEAFAFADRVAVMEAGRIIQVATPEELWAAPASAGVARLIGLSVVDTSALEPSFASALVAGRGPSRATLIAIRPAGVHVVDSEAEGSSSTTHPLMPGVVEARAAAGDSVRVTITLDGSGPAESRRVWADLPVDASVARGDRVRVAVEPDATSVLPAAGG